MKNLKKFILLPLIFFLLLSCDKKGKNDKAVGDKTKTEIKSKKDNNSKKETKKEEELNVVGTIKPVLEDLVRYVILDSNVEPRYSVAVLPDVPGKILRKRVKIGDYVTKGRLLALVDQSKPGLVYRPSLVYAPATGTITQFNPNVGDTVSPTSPMAVISDISSLLITAHVSEKNIGNIKLGLHADVRSVSYPDDIFSAKVTKIYPTVDGSSRTVKIELKFDKRDKRIKAGMFVSTKLYFDPIKDVLQIPSQAILSDDKDVKYVFVDSNGLVKRKNVKLGIQFRNRLQVLEGLNPEDTVIVSGLYSISEDAKVKAKPADIDLDL